MPTFDNRIAKAGNFITHRSLTGAAANDPTTYDDATFPPTQGFRAWGALSMFVTWNGTGGTNADTLDIEPLIHNDINSEWLRLAVVQIKKQGLVEVRIGSPGTVFLRINANSTTATNLQIRVCMGETEHVLNAG